jgi:RNA polymerase sigma-54 factor
MAINTKLELRQTHSLVMTPQLQQAIKLLQLSNLELTNFVEGELERNPLLEQADVDEPNGHAHDASTELAPSPLKQDQAEQASADGEAPSAEGESEPAESDEWVDLETATGVSQTDDLDAEPQDMFPDAEAFAPGALKGSGWNALGQGSRVDSEDGANLEAYVAEERTLRDHLSEQLILAFADPAKRLIGQHLIDMTDEAGYLRGDLEGLAELLGAPQSLIEETLTVMQNFDPCGVFARDLRECLTLQLKEQDRCDPAIAALIDNLHILAVHDLPQLKRVTRVSDEDLCDMIAEVKRLNPKPGLKYGSSPTQPIVPDVLVRALPDGSFHVELNSDTLPRVLVNQSYYATVTKSARKEDKAYLVDCLQTANWLVKSLDQRARTILKVAQEIVRQQDAFLTYGVRHLRPLNLKTVADAISMHESTVSRVTANKYMATNRGLFELKYFFTSAISATTDGDDAHSSEAVRYRIRQMIDAEPAADVLSDDKIVERLKSDGIDIARRTVAKYREALGIPSSVQRRRVKRIALGASP